MTATPGGVREAWGWRPGLGVEVPAGRGGIGQVSAEALLVAVWAEGAGA